MGALEPGAHWGSVIAAYAVTFAIMGLLVAFSLIEARRAKRELDRLEGRSRRRGGEPEA